MRQRAGHSRAALSRLLADLHDRTGVPRSHALAWERVQAIAMQGVWSNRGGDRREVSISLVPTLSRGNKLKPLPCKGFGRTGVEIGEKCPFPSFPRSRVGMQSSTLRVVFPALGTHRTQSVQDGVPTRSVGTSSSHCYARGLVEPGWRSARSVHFPRSHALAWECSLRRSASSFRPWEPHRTQSVQDGIPTRSVGTSSSHCHARGWVEPGWRSARSVHFPRSHALAWERSLRRSASSFRPWEPHRTQSVQDGIPTRSVGTSSWRYATTGWAFRSRSFPAFSIRFSPPSRPEKGRVSAWPPALGSSPGRGDISTLKVTPPRVRASASGFPSAEPTETQAGRISGRASSSTGEMTLVPSSPLVFTDVIAILGGAARLTSGPPWGTGSRIPAGRAAA